MWIKLCSQTRMRIHTHLTNKHIKWPNLRKTRNSSIRAVGNQIAESSKCIRNIKSSLATYWRNKVRNVPLSRVKLRATRGPIRITSPLKINKIAYRLNLLTINRLKSSLINGSILQRRISPESTTCLPKIWLPTLKLATKVSSLELSHATSM